MKIYIYFFQRYIIKNHSPEKMGKKRTKNYYQVNKEKLQKRSRSIIEIFLKIKKLKKEIMLSLKIKIYQPMIEKEKENI